MECSEQKRAQSDFISERIPPTGCRGWAVRSQGKGTIRVTAVAQAEENGEQAQGVAVEVKRQGEQISDSRSIRRWS